MDQLDVTLWEKRLNRELTDDERRTIFGAIEEMLVNQNIEQLEILLETKNLHISHLVNMEGNCLFEAFVELNLFSSVENARFFCAEMMKSVRDSHNIVSDRTVEQAFDDTNEIGFIVRNGEHTKYTYDEMLTDLVTDKSWKRLNTHLLFHVLSKAFCMRFNIHSLGDFVVEIGEGPSVNLALMEEIHYIPLAEGPCEEQLRYSKMTNKFLHWMASFAAPADTAADTAAAEASAA